MAERLAEKLIDQFESWGLKSGMPSRVDNAVMVWPMAKQAATGILNFIVHAQRKDPFRELELKKIQKWFEEQRVRRIADPAQTNLDVELNIIQDDRLQFVFMGHKKERVEKIHQLFEQHFPPIEYED